MQPSSATSRFSSRPRSSPSSFTQDLSTYYLLLNLPSLFKSIKYSCVLYFKDILPPKISPQFIVKDLLSQLERVGKVVKSVWREKSVWVEYEKVEYAQIAYLVMKRHKYDGKEVEVGFYDAIGFAEEF